MKSNPSKNNRRYMFALLFCAGFVGGCPVSAAASDAGIMGVQQQTNTIFGIVKDANGEPIIGASVKIKGSQTGSITDLDGRFKINVVGGGKVTLEISYIGYATQDVEATPGKEVNVLLQEDNQMLEEVVVVGYGTMRKKDLTGSVIQIRPDKLANEAPKTIQDVMRGTPGLNVGYDASAKGGGSLQVRGQRSVYTSGGHNDPLIILDGMQFYGELSEINPQDIAQIDVLKDASAAAVYGAKGANGVIAITTKKGKLGKPTINVSATLGINQKSAYRDVFSAKDYVRYRTDWYKTQTYGVNPETGRYEAYQTGSNAGKIGYYDNPYALPNGVTQDQWAAYTTNPEGAGLMEIWGRRLGLQDVVLQNFINGKTFDWYDSTFRTGINQDYNASISGASERMNYYMSFGYQSNEGAIVGNDYSAFRANLKLSGKVTDWLEIGANINFQDRTDGDISVSTGTSYWDNNMLRNSPYANFKEEDGSYAQYPMGSGVKRGYNYYFDRQYIDLDKGYTVLNTIFNAKVTLPFGFKYEFNVAPRYQFFYNRYFTSAEKPDSNPDTQGVDRENAKRFDWSLNNTITWDHTFNDKHHVVLTLVQEAEERQYWQERIEARGILPTDALGYHEIDNATKDLSNFTSNDTHETAAAYMARLFYSYDDRYMVTATVRRDGYCAFGANNPWATFPSISAAWTFTNEKFFKWEPMSTGKLRLSWGKNGNRSLADPYVALSDLGAGMGKTMGYIDKSGNIVDMKYMSANRLANPNLQWEKTEAYNIGLDFGFFNDRLTGSIEGYFMTTHDMIMSQRLPDFSGFGNITTNLGEVQNRGLEISLNSVNFDRENFTWNTSFGLSWNKNKIKHLYYEMEDVTDAQGNVIGQKEMDDEANGWFIGQPIGVIWDYKVTGIWQADEVEEAAKYGQRPGDPKVENSYTEDDIINDDGTRTAVYNDKDKHFLGQTAPKVRLSLRNDFTLWKNIDFSFSLYSNLGHKSLSGNYLNNDNGGSLITYGYNTFKKEYWTPDNPTNKYARLNAAGPSGAGQPQKLYNRSFVRFDNISLAYTLPQELTRKWQIERVKVYATVRNVGCWGAWEYGDAETGGLATRTYTFGLNLTF